MALYKEHSILQNNRHKWSMTKNKQQTANVGTNAFSATVWKQAQTPPLSTELATHFEAVTTKEWSPALFLERGTKSFIVSDEDGMSLFSIVKVSLIVYLVIHRC